MFEGLLSVVLMAAWGAMYLLPSVVAFYRRVGRGALLLTIVLDVLLGWTVVGWVGALAVACLAPSSVREVRL